MGRNRVLEGMGRPLGWPWVQGETGGIGVLMGMGRDGGVPGCSKVWGEMGDTEVPVGVRRDWRCQGAHKPEERWGVLGCLWAWREIWMGTGRDGRY